MFVFFCFVSCLPFLGGLMSLVVVACGCILTCRCCCWCCQPLLHANPATSGQQRMVDTHLFPLPLLLFCIQKPSLIFFSIPATFSLLSLFSSFSFPVLSPLVFPCKHHAELREHHAASGKPATFQGGRGLWAVYTVSIGSRDLEPNWAMGSV